MNPPPPPKTYIGPDGDGRSHFRAKFLSPLPSPVVNYVFVCFQELDSKHNALLAIYGEKVEENEELRLDLEDVKTMYRQQIEDLVRLQQS